MLEDERGKMRAAFPGQLRDGMALCGMGNTALAGRLGVSKGLVAKWRRGESLPSVEALMALSEALEMSMDLLAKGEEAWGK